MERKRIEDLLRRFYTQGHTQKIVPTAENLPDATTEQVRVRREEEIKAHNLQREYEVESELVIPNRYHAGKALLAPIVIDVLSYGSGTTWKILAFLQPTQEQIASHSRTVLGSVKYHGSKITTEQALEIADGWVRDSCVWVPHRETIPVPKNIAPYEGLTSYLVRGN